MSDVTDREVIARIIDESAGNPEIIVDELLRAGFVRTTQRKEYRLHYSYGVNKGVITGSNVDGIANLIVRKTMGRISVDKVEVRLIHEGPWVEVTADYRESLRKSLGLQPR